jgi:hypothetical protein
MELDSVNKEHNDSILEDRLVGQILELVAQNLPRGEFVFTAPNTEVARSVVERAKIELEETTLALIPQEQDGKYEVLVDPKLPPRLPPIPENIENW